MPDLEITASAQVSSGAAGGGAGLADLDQVPAWAATLDEELLLSALRQPVVPLSDPLKARRAFARASQLSRALLDATLASGAMDIEDWTFIATDGQEIAARHYRPKGLPAPAPVLVYFHGGAFIAGDLDTDHARCLELAQGARCAVISVDYRRAPEHPFPIPLLDCLAAVNWVSGTAVELRIDPRRIAIGGVSAGATLAAGVALRLRDEHSVHPVLQMLLFPALDDRLESESMRKYPVAAGWNVADSSRMWRLYLGSQPAGQTSQ